MMPALMLFTMFACPNGENIYKNALLKSSEAEYTQLGLKSSIEDAGGQIKTKYPTLSTISAAGYTIGVQHKVRFMDTPISLLPHVTVSLEASKNNAIVGITYHF